jgi:hypothetical protein
MNQKFSTNNRARSSVLGFSMKQPAPLNAGWNQQTTKHVQLKTPMKKLTVLLALGAGMALMPSVSRATIVGSAHDFYVNSNYWVGANSGLVGKTASVCGECHDVHKAPDPTRGPLWVHAPSANANSYKTYDQAGSETFNALGLAVSLGTSSKACLSCHDGTVGINQQLKIGLDGTVNAKLTTLGNTNGTASGLVLVPAGFVLAVGGSDLTHVHPIGISYDAAVTALNALNPDVAELNPKSGKFLTSNLQIQSQLKGPGQTQMECSTCHDIHNTRNIPHGQSLCLSCHNK